MKMMNFCRATVVVAAMLTFVGCRNNSTNPSTSTNAVSGAQPSTNDTINNNPAAGAPGAPIATNDPGTNLPSTTNH